MYFHVFGIFINVRGDLASWCQKQPQLSNQRTLSPLAERRRLATQATLTMGVAHVGARSWWWFRHLVGLILYCYCVYTRIPTLCRDYSVQFGWEGSLRFRKEPPKCPYLGSKRLIPQTWSWNRVGTGTSDSTRGARDLHTAQASSSLGRSWPRISAAPMPQLMAGRPSPDTNSSWVGGNRIVAAMFFSSSGLNVPNAANAVGSVGAGGFSKDSVGSTGS